MEKRCSGYFSIIGRGVSHSCTELSFCQNLKEIAGRDENAPAAIVKSVLSTTPVSPSGTIHLKQPQGGYPFQVRLGPASNSNKQSSMLTAEDLVQPQVKTGLSNLKMKKLASTFNCLKSKIS